MKPTKHTALISEAKVVEGDPEGRTYGEMIADVLVAKALSGDVQAPRALYVVPILRRAGRRQKAEGAQ